LPYPANRTLSQLSMMFDWCAEQGLLDENQPNPAKGVKKPGVERERTNVLTDQELALIWHAAVHLGYPWGDWFRLLCLLPNRPIAEVALMQWVEINRDKASWTVPRERSKNRRAHIVPLSEPALDVLDSILQRCPSVFTTGRPGRDGKPGPIMDYRHAKQLIDRWLAGRIEPIRKWIIYDLRRSIATKLVEDLRVRPEVVETCLNHTLPGVLFKHYAHVAFLDEKREALDKWAQHLLQLAEHYKPAPTEEELRTRALLRDAKKHLRAKSLVEANAIALGLDKPARRSRRT
jgi:integrase